MAKPIKHKDETFLVIREDDFSFLLFRVNKPFGYTPEYEIRFARRSSIRNTDLVLEGPLDKKQMKSIKASQHLGVVRPTPNDREKMYRMFFAYAVTEV